MDDQERKQFATFEKHGEFLELLHLFLTNDRKSEPESDEEGDNASRTLQKLTMLLNEYHEQSYLLDPYLENLVTPVAERMRHYARLYALNEQFPNYLSSKFARIADLLYAYINFRGYKTIVRFFPHEISDLTIALDCMLKLSDGHTEWPLRYVMLIWLYLICMIPFDLSQFDELGQTGRTASRLEDLAKSHLGKAGLERDGASLLLSRLYVRKDASSRFSAYLSWTLDQLDSGDNVILSIGALQSICQVAKDGPADVVQSLLSILTSISSAIDRNSKLQINTHVRKFKCKLLARVGMRLLAPRWRTITRGSNTIDRRILELNELGKLLIPPSETDLDTETDEDQDIPSEVENILEQLLECLQDKDTVVRWSASKGVARIAERLPATFVEQVLETVMNLFSIHSAAVASLYDLPSIAESTWHGACLACAEMARRGLVSHNQLPELLDWLSKALYFDLRKGSHSIGSNVRDATAYALWSLARTQAVDALAPHAEGLAHHLVIVSLFDREVHVRRAASATFQEFVGRTALFPAGIDVLRKTDFYAVSVRRNAFLSAAPQVAEHQEYRTALIEHLMNVSIRHWDEAMRELASLSLHGIIVTDFKSLFRISIEKAVRLLDSVDKQDLHGALLALTEIARASETHSAGCEERDLRKNEIFAELARVQDTLLFGHHNDIVLAAALRFIKQTLTLNTTSTPRWRTIIEAGLKHRNPDVQEAAAEAMGRVSYLQDCTQDIKRLITELASAPPIIQQSLGRFLGALRYDANPVCLEYVFDTLLDYVTPMKGFTIEARRTCYQAIGNIVSTVAPCLEKRISSSRFQSLIRALLAGLEDYTNDQRGDVGSWIRIICIGGLSTVMGLLLTSSAIAPDLAEYLPPVLYKAAIAGILKQGLERLNNVRQVAGERFIALLKLPLPSCPQPDRWKLPGSDLFKELLVSEETLGNWGDSSLFFPKAVRFLEIEDFRRDVLAGIIMSIGSKTDSTHRPMTTSLVAYIETLPVTADHSEAFGAVTFVECLTRYADENVKNNNIIVPVFQTFTALLESDVVQRLSQHPVGLQSLQSMFDIVVKNISRIKSISRVQESMKIVVNFLTVEPLSKQCASSLKPFLLHHIPRIRMDTAEYFYLKLQSIDSIESDLSDEVESIVLETEWMSNDQQSIEDACERIVGLLIKSLA
ncbi:hypothetical protein M378DRAFT_191353 [Amanita muscaria Koide BX008]|uniref:Uncharacterized protein n=1 Tax=Amanita muscaria (strain Koide BX008) TaxID=946122 RepID=A0A0C2XED0_AMAMK|nr:hypothetical protein M378DRAFT_191353 [Amanita muscaria Koide BX008]